jgi:hypothetical protein
MSDALILRADHGPVRLLTLNRPASLKSCAPRWMPWPTTRLCVAW